MSREFKRDPDKAWRERRQGKQAIIRTCTCTGAKRSYVTSDGLCPLCKKEGESIS